MKSLCNGIRVQFNESHKPEIVLSLTRHEDIQDLKSSLVKGKLLDVEVKQHRQKRSLDANGYCWVMCQKLAEKLSLPTAPMTKEDVYREAIRKVGQFTILPIKNEAVEQWILNWGHDRTGWVCENLGDSKLEGYTNVMSYYGSSVYDTKSMSLLVDYIVSEAEEQGIETMTPGELARLKSEWGK